MYKLLIVEDETEIRVGLSNYFPWENYGFEVVAQSEDGLQALSIIERLHVDVILCDIMMPVMDGLTLCKEIFSRKLKVTVVFLTGYRDFEYARTAVEYGVRKYLLKPTSHKELTLAFTQIKEELDSASDSAGPVRAEAEAAIGSADFYKSIISLTKEYVSNNIKTATLEGASNAVHLSAPYLSKLFKIKNYENFSDYLMSKKMEKAAELLKEVYNTVYEVSESVGYSNPKNFTRAFRKYFGVTPNEYRKK